MGRQLPPPPNRGGVFPYPVDNSLFWLHGLFSLLIIIALVVGAIVVVRMLLNRPWPRLTLGRPSAIDELDLRYARGEVDRADYLQRRADLLGHPGPTTGPAQPPPAAAPR